MVNCYNVSWIFRNLEILFYFINNNLIRTIIKCTFNPLLSSKEAHDGPLILYSYRVCISWTNHPKHSMLVRKGAEFLELLIQNWETLFFKGKKKSYSMPNELDDPIGRGECNISLTSPLLFACLSHSGMWWFLLKIKFVLVWESILTGHI